MREVSVIMCCYNDGAWLGRALDSVYRQSMPPDRYEVILVNDGSVDDTEEMALPYRHHSNFRYVKNEINHGLVKSCNRALDLARGKYIIRLDADDTFEPTILEEMWKPLERDETDFVYCDRCEILEDQNETRYVRVAEFNVFSLIAIGTMLRRQLVQEIGGYREVFWEEYDLYIRYLLKSDKPPYYIPRPLVNYSIRKGSMTSDAAKTREGWEHFLQSWPPSIVRQFGKPPAIAS